MEERRQIARFTIQRALLEHPRDATIPAALISNATQRLVQRCVSAPAALARGPSTADVLFPAAARRD